MDPGDPRATVPNTPTAAAPTVAATHFLFDRSTRKALPSPFENLAFIDLLLSGWDRVEGAAFGFPAHPGNPDSSSVMAWKPSPARGTISALVAPSDRHVVGRGDEIALLRDFVSAVANGPRALCIRGEAGIGKTTLWRAAIEAEDATGLRVLSARCVEAE